MPVVNAKLRELNGRIKSNIASNQFGNSSSTRGDLRALGTLVTQFIDRIDQLEKVGEEDSAPAEDSPPEDPVAQPAGTNIDHETDDTAEDDGE